MAAEAVRLDDQPPYLLKLKRDMLKRGIPFKRMIQWMGHWPIKWENPYVLITHAGISLHARDPFNPDSSRACFTTGRLSRMWGNFKSLGMWSKRIFSLGILQTRMRGASTREAWRGGEFDRDSADPNGRNHRNPSRTDRRVRPLT